MESGPAVFFIPILSFSNSCATQRQSLPYFQQFQITTCHSLPYYSSVPESPFPFSHTFIPPFPFSHTFIPSIPYLHSPIPRYRCQQCHNYDMCQSCFWSGGTTHGHDRTKHYMEEYCVVVGLGEWGIGVWQNGVLGYERMGCWGMAKWGVGVWQNGVLKYGGMGCQSMREWGVRV